MKVGVSLFAQNYVDWDRFEAAEKDTSGKTPPQLTPDAQIYREQFHLGKLVEPLGFDSLWTVEHHFTPYTMVNNPTQFLAYFAGCTERIDMGTMVAVLPWHDPIAVAEGYVALDHMLDGRNIKVGMGRGLGLREYDGHRIPMDESRERFRESLDVIRTSLSQEWFSYDGQYNKIPRTSLRPQPRPGSTLMDNLYIAWGSPSSMPVAAHENCKPLFIPQRLFDDHKQELGEYNRIRVEEHGWKPERPTIVCWVYCAETDEEAREGALQYLSEYSDSAQRHYQLLGEHLQGLKGYEYYAQMAKMRAAARQDSADLAAIYLSNNVWGSPKTCLEKLSVPLSCASHCYRAKAPISPSCVTAMSSPHNRGHTGLRATFARPWRRCRIFPANIRCSEAGLSITCLAVSRSARMKIPSRATHRVFCRTRFFDLSKLYLAAKAAAAFCGIMPAKPGLTMRVPFGR